ncbi:serine hydrolase domain-containing protein [Peribacillus glennii]|uniref:Class A beta-lactamase-related serine hydrolase n=1 Tax=Peribacillus glennii TaxID=2303991 RepID=A0A372LAZ0_9BACI|nr:serine hydrolase domain-containing protein [Peribacillus glennii]RFU62949.1 class A beta-lactamase-related serine hydrolase [Peribacillus glennii]
MEKFDALRDFMDTVPQLGVSGIDCIVYKDHNLIFRYAAGYSDIENRIPMQTNALYNIYSATKMITCIAALQLVEKGKLLLADPLYTYLPEFNNMKVKSGTFVMKPAKQHIRIVDLFTMCAGLSYELDTPEMRKLMADTARDFSTRDFVKALAKEPLLFEPGEGWNYSYCHDVLGAVIEVVSGMSFGEYLQKNIFDPLGMKDSGFSVPEEKRERIAPQYQYSYETESVVRVSSDCIGAAGLRHESGGGGLITTAEDYILFADALACGGIGKNGPKIISENTINLMRRNQLKGKCLSDYREMVVAEGIGYGLGVSVVMDAAAALRLVPENSFSWGGLGGVQAFIDPANKLSYFVAQHTIYSPKHLIEPKMLNILYSRI